MKLTVGQVFNAFQLTELRNFLGQLSRHQIDANFSIFDELRNCGLEIEIPDEKIGCISSFLEDKSLSGEDLVFVTGADLSSTGVRRIEISKRDGKIFVDRIPVERMKFNVRQLRFEMSFGVYMIFNDDNCHYCYPPRPIKEMYEVLVNR